MIQKLGSLEDVEANSCVIGYGSLLNPDQIREKFDEPLPVTLPLIVKGYKRVFNNRSKWRNPEGKESAMLNVKPAPECWFNGVFIVFRDQDQRDYYEKREDGYNVEPIDKTHLEPLGQSTQQIIDKIDLVEMPFGDQVEPDIEPFPPYVDICLNGAKYWDAKLNDCPNTKYDGDFVEDFIRTTELADGTPLSDWLDKRTLGTVD